MNIYTFSEARQQLATLLNEARRDGEVRIRRRDGQVFVVQPAADDDRSPLDVPGIDTTLARGELAEILRDSRRSTPRMVREVPVKPAKRKKGRA